MKIQDKDFYHGAALTQIVEHSSFKALNKASEKYGHYLVNTDQHVFVKYTKTCKTTPKKSSWQFTLQPEEKKAINEESRIFSKVFLCLVCGDETVCVLDSSEIKQTLNLQNGTQGYIRVEMPSGGSCHVTGTDGELKRTVPNNSFPGKIFS